jgi:hypothetical protein
MMSAALIFFSPHLDGMSHRTSNTKRVNDILDAATTGDKKQKIECKLSVKPLEVIWSEIKLDGAQTHFDIMSSAAIQSYEDYIHELRSRNKIHALCVVQVWFLEFMEARDPEKGVHLKQKTKVWLAFRAGLATGSVAPGLVGHNHYSHTLSQAKKLAKALLETSLSSFSAADIPIKKKNTSSLLDDDDQEAAVDDEEERAKFGGLAQEWGSAKESYSAHCYCQEQYEQCVRAYRQQRKNWLENNHRLSAWKSFTFRNKVFPVTNPLRDPTVEIRNWSFLRSHLFIRGISPDGVLVINGVPCGGVEFKCPYAQRQKLHLVFHNGYYDQLMCELHVLQSYWPSIEWIDYVNWTPTAWTWETFFFNEVYFYKWFLPRESRSYFKVVLPRMCSSLLLKYKKQRKVDDSTTWSAETMMKQKSQFFQFLQSELN